MAQFANMFEVDLNNRSYPVSLVQTVSVGNVYSNRIGAYVYENGAPVNLGGACTGLVMRADGTTVPLTGYVEGNAAYVVLDQPSCAIPGPIQVAVNSVVGENITTLLVAYGTVILTDTRNYVEPGTPIPDITELLAEIDNMREATAEAEAAATKSVRYDTAQSLTSAQKLQARDNIAAASNDDFTSLKSAAENYYGNKITTISPNMYNKADAGIKPGYYATPAGWIYRSGDARLGTTHPLYLVEGTAYKWKNYAIYGENAKYAYKLRYPGDGELVDISNVGTLSNGYYTVTINSTGWYVFNINLADNGAFMFCVANEYPDYYMDYGVARIANDRPNVFLTFDGDGSDQYIVAAKLSPNMFDKSSNLIQTARYCNGWNWADNPGDARIGTMHPVYLKNGVTYKWRSAKSVYGVDNGSYLWRVTSPSDMTLISRRQGTFDANQQYVTWTCSEEGYWVVDIDVSAKDSFMFCISDEYPSNYCAYGVYYASNTIDYSKINSFEYLPIADKTLVCDGDSIAAATPDDPQGRGGWFGRLKDDEKVIGANYAVGGGTITYLSADRHCISRSIDTIHSDYSTVDYLILEGGTNDADLIGQWSGDTPPQGFGTWTASDFSGQYDDTTFCGAVESMFYKSLNYWPHAHIGFIVAMEMGTNLASLTNRKRYFDEIVKIAKKWHIPVLNLWDNSGADARLTAFYDSSMSIAENVAAQKFYRDGQHPSSYGYNKMQPMIEAWVKGL